MRDAAGRSDKHLHRAVLVQMQTHIFQDKIPVTYISFFEL